MIFDTFYDVVNTKLASIIHGQTEVLDAVATCLTEAVRMKRLIHIFGTGHAHLLAEDCFYRAGGFANIDAILYEPLMLHEGAVRSTVLEKESGLAERVLCKYPLEEGDVLIVFSNSGINNVPIDSALYAKAKGLTVVAVTSLLHSQTCASRHPSGKKLYEVADYVLNNYCDIGDAAISIGQGFRVGATSTICGSFLIQSLLAETARRILEVGETPPLYLSANIPGGIAHNQAMIDQYTGLLPHL